jgi:hypothetical protein
MTLRVVVDETDVFEPAARLFEQDPQILHRLLSLCGRIPFPDEPFVVQGEPRGSYEKDLVRSDDGLACTKVPGSGVEAVARVADTKSLVGYQCDQRRLYFSSPSNSSI